MTVVESLHSLLTTIATPIGIDPTELARWVPVLLTFCGSALAVWLVARRWTRQPEPVAARLARITPPSADDRPEEGTWDALRGAFAAQIPESKKERRDFQQLLRGAGLYGPHAAATFYALRFVLLVAPLVAAGVAAVMADSRRTPLILIVGAVAATALSIIPRLYVFFRRRRRLARIRRGLADTMDMLSMCVGGGMGLSQSLDHVARQLTAYPDLAQELLILKRQAEVGSLEQALADFAERIDLAEVRQLAALLTRGDRLGTKLAGSLLHQADHLRVARKQRATLAANKAPVKLVLPLMFCFAPAALILLTAPAVLELKEFLVPSNGQGVLSSNPADRFPTSSIIQTLEDLEQNLDAPR